MTDSKKRPSTASTTGGISNPFAQTASSFKTTVQKTPQNNLSYKEYAIREEKLKLKKNEDLRTPTNLKRPSTATHAASVSFEPFKVRAQKQFNNFIAKRQRNMVNDDDSLLQDSQRSYTREEKKAILVERQAKKRADLREQQRLKNAKTQRIKQSLSQLGLTSKQIREESVK